MKFQATAILLLALLPGCGHVPSTAVQAPVAHVAAAKAAAKPAAVAAKAEVAAPAPAEVAAPVATRDAAVVAAPVVAAEAPQLTPAGEFVRLVASARQAATTSFHVSGSVQRDSLLTAELDGTLTAAGGTLTVTDSNVPGAKGQEVRWDAAQPLALQTPKGAVTLPGALLALNPASLSGVLTEVASHVQGEEIVQRDGQDVAMFTITGSPIGDLKVGFPVAGGPTTYVEGADHLSLVLSAR